MRYVESIKTSSVYDIAIKTPITQAKALSDRLGNAIYLKREDLQPVFSFKLRGAYQKISSLSEIDKQKGIIAASAGNHAQGVALSAQKLGIEATIVMPKTTPDIKVESVRNMGATAVLEGDTYDEAYHHAKQLEAKLGLTFISPYDDPDVIAGQGTVGKEIVEQFDPTTLDAIFVPVGGGGLIAGVAVYVKSLYPNIKIIGVEPEDAACMSVALKAKERIILPTVEIGRAHV